MSVSPRIGFLYFDCDRPLNDHRGGNGSAWRHESPWRAAIPAIFAMRPRFGVSRAIGEKPRMMLARAGIVKNQAATINVAESLTLSSRALLRAIDRTQNNACVL
ncbi:MULTISPECIES: hypothetical protein [Burkholderia]|uniref:hypothetical protein n=1 Tax=Burkholderia TaxID=32008 RepID=UPI000F7991D3|nr:MULTISPECIES: hypothetical protein [Burkholderia]